MKRNFDLIRLILLNIEEHDFEGMANEMVFIDHSHEEVSYNAHLLWQGGYIEGTDATRLGMGPMVVIKKLTWKGHDFLDSIRDATVWEKTKTMLHTKSLAVTFEGIKLVAPFALKAIFNG